MFRGREEIRQQLHEIIEKFRQKGATSPEKAMTVQELGLPPRFEEAMHRRLGRSGIFVEVNGKYYLSEERLKQIQERFRQGSAGGGGGSPRKTLMTLRVARLTTTFLVVALLLVNVFVQSWEIRLTASLFLAAGLVLFIAYVYHLSRVAKRFSSFRQTH